jgi:exosortase
VDVLPPNPPLANPVHEPLKIRPIDIAPWIPIGLILGWAYWSSLKALSELWSNDTNYSHGWFVVPIAIVIGWTRRDMIDRSQIRLRWWNFLPLAAILGLRYVLFDLNEQYLETATIPFVVAALTLAIGGWHLLRAIWPAALFLFLMLPLPPSLNGTMAGPLQAVATAGSVGLLQAFGLPVLAEGNVIIVGAERLEVARACNGLSMMLSFVTLITAMVILVRRPIWERVVLLMSTVPIAIISNILRITATAWCFQYLGHDLSEKYAHDWAGYLMMPVALGLVLLELKLMSWLIVEEETPNERFFSNTALPQTHPS